MREGRRQRLFTILVLILLRLVGLVGLRHPPPACLCQSVVRQSIHLPLSKPTDLHECKATITQHLYETQKTYTHSGTTQAHSRYDSRGGHIHLPAYEEPSHSTRILRPATCIQSSLIQFNITAEPGQLFSRHDRQRHTPTQHRSPKLFSGSKAAVDEEKEKEEKQGLRGAGGTNSVRRTRITR
jgi:hypothetical protein